MAVLIDNRQDNQRIAEHPIEEAAKAILSALDNPDGELSILLVDDPGIAALNQQYLQRPGPTNVISFPMQEGAHGEISPQLLGDVVISIDTACREAGQGGISADRRFKELLVHGILHLLGYDHEDTPEREIEMEAQSKRLMGILAGSPPVIVL